jgi:hypothetical protein
MELSNEPKRRDGRPCWREPAGLAVLGAWLLGGGPGLTAAGAAEAVRIPQDYKLLYEQTFSKEAALSDFRMTDPGAWQRSPVKPNETDHALALVRQSKYSPAVRSPVNIALIGGQVFEDFILEVDMKQTGREYGHRDMCLFFGFQEPDKFYYAHIATQADDHAHNVFIVNEAPRIKIAEKTTAGVNWGVEVWRKVRLERRGSDGSIRVYYDDMTTPIMEAKDARFRSGRIGFGSFDDTGMVDNIRIWGPTSRSEATEAFDSPPNN